MYEKIDNFINAIGILYGLTNIQQILGIIILVLNILSIFIKSGIAIYNKIKKKQFNDIVDIIDNTAQEIEKLKEANKNGEDRH